MKFGCKAFGVHSFSVVYSLYWHSIEITSCMYFAEGISRSSVGFWNWVLSSCATHYSTGRQLWRWIRAVSL